VVQGARAARQQTSSPPANEWPVCERDGGMQIGERTTPFPGFTPQDRDQDRCRKPLAWPGRRFLPSGTRGFREPSREANACSAQTSPELDPILPLRRSEIARWLSSAVPSFDPVVNGSDPYGSVVHDSDFDIHALMPPTPLHRPHSTDCDSTDCDSSVDRGPVHRVRYAE